MLPQRPWNILPAPKASTLLTIHGLQIYCRVIRVLGSYSHIIYNTPVSSDMSYQNRPVNPSLRHPSMGGSQASAGQSPMLVARINEKKAELESLKQLRDLSGGLAAQMQALEEKLSTLSDGTEGEPYNIQIDDSIQSKK